MTTYRLLSGETVSLPHLRPRERAFLRNLRQMMKQGVSYFEIERSAIGPGSPALEGRNRVDRRIVTSPLYRVARDIATRAGIAEGLILAPRYENRRSELPTDGSMISVTQAADFLGISRAAVHKAIQENRLKGRKIGNLVIVDRRDCERYRAARQSPGDELKSKASSAGPSGETRVTRSTLAARGR